MKNLFDKYGLYLAGLLFLGLIIWSIDKHRKYENALKDSAEVVGTIKSLEQTKGATIVNVEYYYEEKRIRGYFSTYNLDSLRTNVKIRLKVAKSNPAEYIKFIGVVTE